MFNKRICSLGDNIQSAPGCQAACVFLMFVSVSVVGQPLTQSIRVGSDIGEKIRNQEPIIRWL